MGDRNYTVRQNYSTSKGDRGGVSQRRRKRNLRVFYAILITVVIFAAAAVACTLLLKVSSVVVSGSSIYSQDEILNAATIKAGDNLVTADTKAAGAAIEKALPYIKSAVVTKKFPSTISVSVVEDNAFCQISQGGVYVLCDDSTKVLEIASAAKENITTVTGVILVSPTAGEKAGFLSDDVKNTYNSVVTELTASELDKTKIISIDLTDLTKISFVYENRLKVILGNQNDLKYKMAFCYKIVTNADGTGLDPKDSGTLDLSRATNTDTCIYTPSSALESSSASSSSSTSSDTTNSASSGEGTTSSESENSNVSQ